jgi:hypothetical protein
MGTAFSVPSGPTVRSATGGDPGTTTRIFFDAKTNIGAAMFMNITRSDSKGNPVAQDFSDIQKVLGWP